MESEKIGLMGRGLPKWALPIATIAMVAFLVVAAIYFAPQLLSSMFA